MPNTEDVRVTRTRAAIMNAFEEMICEEKAEEINVKALAERAGIHRKTFYLHYSSIEALYADAIRTLVQDYNELVEKLPPSYNYYDLTRILFEFGTRNRYTEILYCNPKYADLFLRIRNATLEHNRALNNPFQAYSPEMQSICNAFVTNASNTAFRQWVNDGKKVPMEEAVEMVSTLLEQGVSAIRTTYI